MIRFKTLSVWLLAAALVVPAAPRAQQTPAVSGNMTLGDILQQAVKASDELNIIASRIQQAQSGLGEARANYYPQVTLTERFGRDAAYPSSARTKTDPRGQSEYVNANSTKMEINQMLFDGFKTPAEVERQEQSLEALEQRYRTTSQQVVRDTLEVYLTAWRHLQALRAGVAMVEDLGNIKRKVDLQAEAGAADMTAKSYVDSRLTGATQQLLKTRNAYRESLYRLGFLLQQQIQPEHFAFAPLLSPRLQELDVYLTALKATSPELLEEQANMNASQQDLRKAKSPYYPTLSLTSDLQDSNDLGGSVGTVRTGNAMVQVSYKLFDGYAARHGKARAKSQITESEHRIRRTTRRLEEDLSQAWRKAVASDQEAALAGEEATASLKVKQLRAQDVESGNGDIVRLIEAEEALYTSILRQLDLVQSVTAKRYDLAVTSGQLDNLACVDGGCADVPMEPVAYINPVEVEEVKTVADPVSTQAVVSDTTNLLPEGTEAPVTPPITGTATSPTEPLVTEEPQAESTDPMDNLPPAVPPSTEASPTWSSLTAAPQEQPAAVVDAATPEPEPFVPEQPTVQESAPEAPVAAPTEAPAEAPAVQTNTPEQPAADAPPAEPSSPVAEPSVEPQSEAAPAVLPEPQPDAKAETLSPVGRFLQSLKADTPVASAALVPATAPALEVPNATDILPDPDAVPAQQVAHE